MRSSPLPPTLPASYVTLHPPNPIPAQSSTITHSYVALHHPYPSFRSPPPPLPLLTQPSTTTIFMRSPPSPLPLLMQPSTSILFLCSPQSPLPLLTQSFTTALFMHSPPPSPAFLRSNPTPF
ncbi:uncharacterized protein LOC132550889 [Ylistrum balloti]|uniref:uncharacterized protein LOC132550889 n=1 Tax=Ylistrum balloti TaxID=509963 RepID=UPI00290598D2|nr:uncharacterized protein LOC132550889 [Ylistrum balloti]